jgi:hypothetical protein
MNGAAPLFALFPFHRGEGGSLWHHQQMEGEGPFFLFMAVAFS